MATKNAASKKAEKTKQSEEITYTVASPESKVAEITKDLKKMEKQTEVVAMISNEEGYVEATTFAVDVKGRVNRIKKLKTEYVKPLKDAVKQIEGLFNEPLKHYEHLEKVIKGSMSNFRIEQEKAARKEEDRLRKLKEKREERKAEKGDTTIDPTPMPTVERADTTIKTDAGKATTKKVWRHELQDADKALAVKETHDMVMNLAIKKGLLDQVLRGKVKDGLREHDGVRIYEDIDISLTA